MTTKNKGGDFLVYNIAVSSLSETNDSTVRGTMGPKSSGQCIHNMFFKFINKIRNQNKIILWVNQDDEREWIDLDVYIVRIS